MIAPPPNLSNIVKSLIPEFIWKTWFFSLHEELKLIERVMKELVPAGYFGARQVAAIPGYDIPTGYVTLPVDSLSPSASRGGSVDIASDQFTFTASGVWTAMISFNIQSFAGLNAGRSFNVRLFNVSQGIAGSGIVVGVGRNTEDVFFNVSFLDDVSQRAVDDGEQFRVELGGIDAITGGTLIGSTIQFTHSSELGALI